jgi:hypothetical protein
LDFFIKIDVLIRITKLVSLIKILHSKGLERRIGDVGAKKRTLFDVFNKVWHYE